MNEAMNEFCGHPTFRPDTWAADIYIVNDKRYVVEMYQNGNFLESDEEWGSIIIDLESMKFINLMTYGVNMDIILTSIKEWTDKWCDMPINENRNTIIEYYLSAEVEYDNKINFDFDSLKENEDS